MFVSYPATIIDDDLISRTIERYVIVPIIISPPRAVAIGSKIRGDKRSVTFESLLILEVLVE